MKSIYSLLAYKFSIGVKERVVFTPKHTFHERILTTSLANYDQDTLDGDSYASQSTFGCNELVGKTEMLLHAAEPIKEHRQTKLLLR